MRGQHVTWVPVTPAGTMLFNLAAHTAVDAWKNLLLDAAHMPYKGVEGFKRRGYTVERVTTSREEV